MPFDDRNAYLGLKLIAKAIAFLGLCIFYAQKPATNPNEILEDMVKHYKEGF